LSVLIDHDRAARVAAPAVLKTLEDVERSVAPGVTAIAGRIVLAHPCMGGDGSFVPPIFELRLSALWNFEVCSGRTLLLRVVDTLNLPCTDSVDRVQTHGRWIIGTPRFGLLEFRK
jgi:hypothetical protein